MVDGIKKPSFGYDIPLQGIKKAQQSMAERAERISNLGSNGLSPSDPSFVEDVVGLKTDTIAVKANTAVIKSISELEDSILDILA